MRSAQLQVFPPAMTGPSRCRFCAAIPPAPGSAHSRKLLTSCSYLHLLLPLTAIRLRHVGLRLPRLQSWPCRPRRSVFVILTSSHAALTRLPYGHLSRVRRTRPSCSRANVAQTYFAGVSRVRPPLQCHWLILNSFLFLPPLPTHLHQGCPSTLSSSRSSRLCVPSPTTFATLTGFALRGVLGCGAAALQASPRGQSPGHHRTSHGCTVIIVSFAHVSTRRPRIALAVSSSPAHARQTRPSRQPAAVPSWCFGCCATAERSSCGRLRRATSGL